MDNTVQTTSEQANNSKIDIPRRRASSGRGGSPHWGKQDDVINETEQRHECRRSSEGCVDLALWEEQQTCECETKTSEKEHVYDLVDCGPRHRFVVRNDQGDVFISHNSMGHGIDGLQDSGSILVWFGVNWSLELYEQMVGRLDRNGQKRPVSIIRILCNDTIDLAVVDAIERKRDDQEGLKAALQRYRDGITTNDLEVNFF